MAVPLTTLRHLYGLDSVPDPETLERLYQLMVRIRRFDERPTELCAVASAPGGQCCLRSASRSRYDGFIGAATAPTRASISPQRIRG